MQIQYNQFEWLLTLIDALAKKYGRTLRAMGSQVPSHSHVNKSQHGDKVPTFEPQETIKIWLIIINVWSWSFYAKTSHDLCWELGLVFLLDPTLNTNFELRLQKVLPCQHPFHIHNIGLGTPCELALTWAKHVVENDHKLQIKII